jgi:dTDP-3,4-didehydro-2,6-dideoxy-alpha-D-glucose 3-reductase
MHILFIGYSNLVKKRILPILSQLEFISKVSIAKYDNQVWDNNMENIELFDNYNAAYKECTPDIVYVSTVNSTHFEYAELWLKKKCHVIVDKPATLNLFDATKLIKLAKSKKCLIAESTVYLYHPQFSKIKNIFLKYNDKPKFITAHFSFPPLNPDNFRYNAELGGGAIYDTAAYCVSLGRYFFNDKPNELHAVCNEKNKDELDLSYSVLMKYKNNSSMIGHFGFTSEYINRLTLIGSKLIIDVDRVFTIPEDYVNNIYVKYNNKTETIQAPSSNTFINFLNEINKDLQTKQFDKFAEDMQIDAEVTSMILKNIKL